MKSNKGFTLMEIMIVVAIISIIAAIAWPNYQGYVAKSKRTAAAACLMEQAQFMERFYTQNMSYAVTREGADVALPGSGCTVEMASDYTFTLVAVDDTTFEIEAEPQGTQAAQDDKCGTLGVDNTGKKTATGSGGAGKCW